MDFKHFPIEKYLKLREANRAFLQSFYAGTGARVAVSQRPGYQFTGPICRYRDRQLENELEYIAQSMMYRSDLMLSSLEPWLGVGIYAAGFGAKYIWTDTAAPQTRAFVKTPEEIASLRLKPLSEWEEMQEVLARIRYFKQETAGQIGITLTDTQSPNDTASLIMDAAEFFADCLDEPESVAPLLEKVTDAIIRYSRIQMEEIGDVFCAPGHIAVSGFGVNSVMLSGDNLAILSPSAFRNSEAAYLERIAEAFGGVCVHSCGRFTHNVKELLALKGLRMFDCCVDLSDPNPNDPRLLAEMIKGRPDVIVQARVSVHRADVLKPLIDSGARLHILFGPDPDPLVSNRLVESFKDKYL
ncbi:MAG: hypothetical protein IK140_04955 [Clostridia bacterium]|nr:hypothetical protein [Clostridia bacterium]